MRTTDSRDEGCDERSPLLGPHLRPAIEELLTHLEEEAAEVIQACTKLRRFGPEERDPRLRPSESPTNRKALALELGQLLCVVDCLQTIDPTYFRDEETREGWERKADRLQKYLKHSKLSLIDGEVRMGASLEWKEGP